MISIDSNMTSWLEALGQNSMISAQQGQDQGAEQGTGATGDTVNISDEARALLEAKLSEYVGKNPDDLTADQIEEVKGVINEAIKLDAQVAAAASGSGESDSSSDGQASGGGGAAVAGAAGGTGGGGGTSSSTETQIENLEKEIEELEQEIEELQAKAATDETAKEQLAAKQTELAALQSELAELQTQSS